MTSEGGIIGVGVIFSFDLSSSVYTKLFDFDIDTTGGYPRGGLIQASDGKLYGMTSQGTDRGTSRYGIIFSFDPSLLFIQGCRILIVPEVPYQLVALVQANDGKLYGMTAQGGSNNRGVIFSL